MNLSTQILSDITVYMKYARYIPEKGRRETWEELVTRNKEMHIKKFPQLKYDIEDAYRYVYDKKVLPSMRSMQFAGKPIEVNPSRVYNCAFLPIDDWRSFSEVMFLLLGGTGVGYSVQHHHIENLPEIKRPNPKRTRRYLVGDSIEGWADAVKVLMKSYFFGTSKVRFDFSDIRPKGSRLITSGGKAPGPQPLMDCLRRVEDILSKKQDGERLEAIEVHDIVCHLADAVLAGGIRRAALISLFSLNDQQMIEAKSLQPVEVVSIEQTDNDNTEVIVNDSYYGQRRVIFLTDSEVETLKETGKVQWYHLYPHRGRANNSAAVLRHKITQEVFLNLWDKIKNSGSGEPGVYLTNDKDWGTNPCCEIALRPYQFCNLTEINASDIESQEDFVNRAKAAALLGTLQASYTDFHYLRSIWRKTTEKDALIGVSMTGIASGVVLSNEIDMTDAALAVRNENERVAKLIGINPAARTTTVKPAGTTSLTLGTSSGIHAWHNDYYIRRIRVGKNEAIYKYLATLHPELVEDEAFRPHDTAVISVPQKAPEGAITRSESAIDLLERVKTVKKGWVDPGHIDGQNSHNISATVTIKPDEWDIVAKWMWDNREYYNGLSVLPHSEHTYVQAPFEDITAERYYELEDKLLSVDLQYVREDKDETNLMGELACAGGACEIV